MITFFKDWITFPIYIFYGWIMNFTSIFLMCTAKPLLTVGPYNFLPESFIVYVYINERWWFKGAGRGKATKWKATKTSGGGMPVRHTIPLGIVIFLIFFFFCHPA